MESLADCSGGTNDDWYKHNFFAAGVPNRAAQQNTPSSGRKWAYSSTEASPLFFFYSMVKWESEISSTAAPFLLVTTTMSVLFWSILWSVWIGKPHSNLHSSDSSTGFGSLLWCIFTAGLSMLEISVPSCIRSQQAASDLKDSSEDPCWSQQDCSLKCCQFYSSIYVFQVALQSLRNSNRCFDNNEDKFTLFIFLSSLIWIARSRYLLIFSSFFGVYPSDTRVCNVADNSFSVRPQTRCWDEHWLWHSFLSVCIEKSQSIILIIFNTLANMMIPLVTPFLSMLFGQICSIVSLFIFFLCQLWPFGWQVTY